MKHGKFILTSLIITAAIGSAFATKPMANRNLWTNSDGSCSQIFCRTTNIENMGACPNTHMKFTNNSCTNVYTGQAFVVEAP